MRHLPHIDGLRSLAIVPVVAFHADVALFSGGFTGVDIFFAISGFLITTIIVDELRSGRFSLLEFYKRRALRILPAYFALIIAVIIAAYFLMLPAEASSLGWTVAAASVFVSNIYFWRTTGYFNSEAKAEPLLHTWTLSVEEQFYIVLPIMLLLVARYARGRYGLAILLVSIVSFAASWWGLKNYEVPTFYLLPTRAWEFGLGALLAVVGLGAVRDLVPSAAIRQGLAALGLGLIGYGIFGLDQQSSFPGPNALFPVIGAVLLIAFAEGTSAGRVLSTSPFVWIGRISYSVYLWHWPIIVFYKIRFGPLLGPLDVTVIVVASFALGALSYAFIEQPFRQPAMRARPALRMNGYAMGFIALAAGVGLALTQIAGNWRSFPPEIHAINAYLEYVKTPEFKRIQGPPACMIHAKTPGRFTAFDQTQCLPHSDDQPNWLLLGDSHAGHLMHALKDALPDINLQVAGASGCRPVIDAEGSDWCTQLIPFVLNDHIPAKKLDGVILSARWTPQEADRLVATAAYLATHASHVIVLGPAVEYLDAFPKLLARNKLWGSKSLEDFRNPLTRQLDEDLQARSWPENVRYVSLYDLMCAGDKCTLLTQTGEPYHFDYGHYTDAAAREVAEKIAALGLIVPQIIGQTDAAARMPRAVSR